MLTSTIARWNRGEGESIGDVKLGDVRIPTLVVHHGEAACPFTPYSDIPGLLRDLSKTPQARAAHGYLGLDAEVVRTIAEWIKATPRP